MILSKIPTYAATTIYLFGLTQISGCRKASKTPCANKGQGVSSVWSF